MVKKFSFSNDAFVQLSDKDTRAVMLDDLFEKGANIYIINEKDAKNINNLKNNLKGRSLEDGYLFFDLPNFSDADINYEKIINTILKTVKVNENTKVYALHNKYNHFEEHEFKGLENLNKLIATSFPKNNEGKDNELFFPNVLLNNTRLPLIMLNYVYNLESVKKSSAVVNYALNKIREKNLSPYEQFLASYTYVASFKYNQQGNVEEFEKKPAHITQNSEMYKYYLTDDMDPFLSRTVVNSLTTGLIVCATYADMLALMCNRLNESMTNGNALKAVAESVESIDEDEFGNELIVGHRRTVVNLQDKKYNIKGIYLSDPTNDSQKDNFGLDFKQYLFHAAPITTELLKENSDYVNYALGEPFSVRDGNQKEVEAFFTEEGFLDSSFRVPRRYQIINFFNNKVNEIDRVFAEKISKTKNENEISKLEDKKTDLLNEEFEKLSVLQNKVESMKETFRFEFMLLSHKTKAISPQVFVEALSEALQLVSKSKDREVYAKSLYVKNAQLFSKNFEKSIDTFNIENNQEFYNKCKEAAFDFNLNEAREM